MSEATSEAAVDAALDQLYQHLDPDAQAVLRAVSALPLDRFYEGMLVAAVGSPAADVARAVDILVAAHLMTVTGDVSAAGRSLQLVSAPSTRAMLRRHDQTNTRAEQDERALRRALDWMLTTTATTEHLLAPYRTPTQLDVQAPPKEPVEFADPDDAWVWLQLQLMAVRPLVAAAAEAGWHRTVWQLARVLFTLLHRTRDYELWLWTYNTARTSARLSGERRVERMMANTYAVGLRGQHRFDEALEVFTSLLAQAEQDGDALEQAKHLHAVGATHRAAGRPGDALELLARAAALRTTHGYDRGAAVTGIELACAHADLGFYEQALEELDQARATLLQQGDQLDAMRALAWTGRIHTLRNDRGQHDQKLAARLLSQALREASAVGARAWEARIMEWLGLAARTTGGTSAAAELLRQSLDVYTEFSPADARRIQDHLAALGERGQS